MSKYVHRVENVNEAISRLEGEHRTLKARVAELDRRAILTRAEQREAVDLKKRKLATKDALEGLRRGHIQA